MSMTTVTFSIDKADLDELELQSLSNSHASVGDLLRRAVRWYLYPNPDTRKEWRVVVVPGFDNPGKPRSYNLEGHIKKEAASGWTIVSVLSPSDSIDQWIVVCR